MDSMPMKPPVIFISATLYLAARVIIGLMFVISGGIKITDPYTFAATIDAFGMLPSELVFPLALLLPPVEILAGIGLILDIRGSLATISVLLGGFIMVLAYAISLGLDVDCGCYGPNDPEAGIFSSLWTSLYRDLAMVAGSAFLYWFRISRSLQLRRAREIFSSFATSHKETQCIR